MRFSKFIMEFSKGIKEKFKEVARGAPKNATKIDIKKIENLLEDTANLLGDIDIFSLLHGKKLEDTERFENAFKTAFIKNFTAKLENNIFIEKRKGKLSAITIKDLRLEFDEGNSRSFKLPLPIDIVFENNTFLYEGEFWKKISIDLLNYGIIEFNHNKFTNVELHFGISESNSPINKQIQFTNNKISTIQCPVYAQVNFNRNVIDIFKVLTENENENEKFSVRWTPNQRIDPKKKQPNTNKASFIVLKERAVRKGDKFQEAILNREILKCESIFFKQENAPWQDRFIMWFGELVSKHGVSWARPLSLLLFINFVLAFIAFWIAEVCPFFTIFAEASFSKNFLNLLGEIFSNMNFLEVLVEMFNPISNLAKTMEPLKVDGNVAISIINIVQKAVFALLVYELIRVGRRFT